ncbi:helix-turn-helix domain-containing protein [Rhodococcus hoagii]|nr:helix-turn-helix domain-containing protein [Prescottella equi]NKS02696.1 helix-turn-helix domain-containing protein [Prescottella equi]NKS04792.1 helix-turn-helix domain-containing protein [Prescottella equi]NKS95711.1 helix-turn-helix domain-containing protein [Prescottella equi]NKT11552.1 helix-turn-helix domain-containing protein [Prescottella equi]
MAEDRFGLRVREEREARGWTQATLARLLEDFGVSLHPSAIAKIELRDVDKPRAIRLEEADAIATAFGMSIDEMCSAEGSVHRVKKLQQELERAGNELSRWDLIFRDTAQNLRIEFERLSEAGRADLGDDNLAAIEVALGRQATDFLDVYPGLSELGNEDDESET